LGDDLGLNVRGPSRVFVVIAGRVLLVGCRSIDAADRSRGSRRGRGSVGGWLVGVSWVRGAGRAAWLGAVSAGADRGRVPAGAGLAEAAACVVSWLRALACVVAVLVFVPAV
jgi:hypothetical protein